MVGDGAREEITVERPGFAVLIGFLPEGPGMEHQIYNDNEGFRRLFLGG
jgi:hypothetical protein